MNERIAMARELLKGTGYTAVPIIPTKEMMQAGEIAIEDNMDSTRDSNGSYLIEDPDLWASVAYRAMVDTAP